MAETEWPCRMMCGEPYPFAWCETHDTTFPLGQVCEHYKPRDPVGSVPEALNRAPMVALIPVKE